MRRAAALLVLFGAAVACDASGEPKGGEVLFDAAPAPVNDICFVEEAGAGGTTWTALYRDFFGPTARSTCAGDGTCHGKPEESGTRGSKYLCADKDGCHASLLGEAKLVEPEDARNPDDSALIGVLRRRRPDGSPAGAMPRRPACRFSEASIERIRAWIRGGAPND